MTTRAQQQPEDFSPEPTTGTVASEEVAKILSEFAFASSIDDAQNKLVKDDVSNGSDSEKEGGIVVNEASDGPKTNENNAANVDKDIRINGDSINKQLMEAGINGFKMSKLVTEKDRTAAKERLANDISALVPEADRESMKALQDALIDGDLSKLQETLKGLSSDPEKLATMVKEVNERFNKHELYGGLDLSMDSNGDLLVYKEQGGTAVSINPATGETALRAVERQVDGSMLLKPGEILNRNAEDELHSIADSGARSLTSMPKPMLKDYAKPPNSFPNPVRPHVLENIKPKSEGKESVRPGD